MELVPWRYINVHVDVRRALSRSMVINGHTITVEQAPHAQIDIGGNTGALMWDGAWVLARFLESLCARRPGAMAGRRVLELGAGTGFCGLAARALGAGEVVLTDVDEALPLLRRNVRAAEGGGLRVERLEWGGEVGHVAPPFDVVLCSEVVYLHEAHTALLACLEAVCGDGTTVWCAYKERGLGEGVWAARVAGCGTFRLREMPQSLLDPECVRAGRGRAGRPVTRGAVFRTRGSTCWRCGGRRLLDRDVAAARPNPARATAVGEGSGGAGGSGAAALGALLGVPAPAHDVVTGGEAGDRDLVHNLVVHGGVAAAVGVSVAALGARRRLHARVVPALVRGVREAEVAHLIAPAAFVAPLAARRP